MSILGKFFLVVLCLFCHLSTGKSLSQQHCHSPTAKEPIPFCVATKEIYNTTTEATDLFVTFAYQKSLYGGWGAIGIGDSMFGALIFMTYGEESEEDDLILSVRAGEGHFEPRPSATLPVVHLLRSSTYDSEWVEISFSCLGFDDGTGKYLDLEGDQQWIWAFNTLQSFSKATGDSSLAKHDHWGYFSFHMTDRDLEEDVDGSVIPKIDPTLPNQEGDHSGIEYRSPSIWIKTHGSLLILGSMILYPCGAFTMRIRSKHSFKGHLIFQSLASICCLAGATVAFFFVDLTLVIDSRIGPHVLIGMMVLLLIPLQFILGYLHHRASSSSLENPMMRKSHAWAGRLLVFGGCVNAIIGQWLVGASAISVIFTRAVFFVDICLLVGLYCISSQDLGRKFQDLGKRMTDTAEPGEDGVPFLRHDECEDDGDSGSTKMEHQTTKAPDYRTT